MSKLNCTAQINPQVLRHTLRLGPTIHTHLMLAQSVNASLYPTWLAHVSEPGARDAFVYLVGFAATLKSLTCHARFKGAVRDFRFYAAAEEQSFSFIINKKWLLFYFRSPSVRSCKYSAELLAQQFPSMKVNTRGEWTVRIASLQEAQRLTCFLAIE